MILYAIIVDNTEPADPITGTSTHLVQNAKTDIVVASISCGFNMFALFINDPTITAKESITVHIEKKINSIQAGDSILGIHFDIIHGVINVNILTAVMETIATVVRLRYKAVFIHAILLDSIASPKAGQSPTSAELIIIDKNKNIFCTTAKSPYAA